MDFSPRARTTRYRRLVPLGLLVLGGHLACGPDPTPPAAPAAAPRLASAHGLFQNGLTSNGLFQNGLFQNGLFQNGLFQNGLFQNGLFQNGLFQNGLWQANLAAREILRTNAYTREFLTYLYQCAMPEGVSTTLDPRVISPPGVDPPIVDPEAANLTLRGRIGLAPEWQIEGGGCDESCQRWLSACLLARTNAYGAPVDISMRVPDDAPPHVQAALKPAPESGELATFPLREGAYYGNLFRQVEQPSDDGLPVMVMAPTMHACAGPGSNIPDVTKRFCSSQGADGPIRVVGTCEAREDFPRGACEGISGADPCTGAMQRCYSDTNPAAPRTEYAEVITVYLKQPIEECGNAICEANEALATAAADGQTPGEGGARGDEGGAGASCPPHELAGGKVCPSDCHPGGWGKSFVGLLTTDLRKYALNDPYPGIETPWTKTSAVGPDDEVVLAGIAPSSIGLGGPPLEPGEGGAYGALAKYGPNGDYQWGVRFGSFANAAMPASVVVSPDRSIGVLVTDAADSWDDREPHMWLGKFEPDEGAEDWSGRVLNGGPHEGVALAADSGSNLIAAGVYYYSLGYGDSDNREGGEGGDLFGNARATPYPAVLEVDLPYAGGQENAFVTKVSKYGYPQWLVALEAQSEGDGTHRPLAVAVDGDDNVLVTLQSSRSETGLWKLSGETGEVLWSRRGFHHGVAAGPNGHVYAAGMLAPPSGEVEDFASDTYDFNVPPTARGGDFFVVEYDAGGAVVNRRIITPACRGATPPCAGRFDGRYVSVDAAGNVAVGVLGGNRDTIDFGAGAFRTYATDDLFVAAFSPALEPRWAKHVPLVLDGSPRGLQINSVGRGVMSGTFGGSMLFDSRLLVSNIPEQREVGNTFLAVFSLPSLGDTAPPEVAHVPLTMVYEATSPLGAEVFYTLPTSLDAGRVGVNVDCIPPPNSVFPLGLTTVSCLATDPVGNQTPASFSVTVLDQLGPAFSQVPAPITVDAGGESGATVIFEPPFAVDLVDGISSVICEPASGSFFPSGTTPVVCSATDASGHRTEVSFPVTVVDTAPPGLPTLTLPISAEATATSTQGALVTYVASASDAAGAPLVPTCSPASGSMFAPGSTTVTCSATDTAGHTATAAFPVAVTYAWSGLLKPLDASNGHAFELGKPINVQFRLTGASAPITDLHATLTAVKTTDGGADRDPATDVVRTTVPFSYNPSTGRYAHRLATRNLSAGDWLLYLDFGDGVPRSVSIYLW